jgi:hypothetical protein
MSLAAPASFSTDASFSIPGSFSTPASLTATAALLPEQALALPKDTYNKIAAKGEICLKVASSASVSELGSTMNGTPYFAVAHAILRSDPSVLPAPDYSPSTPPTLAHTASGQERTQEDRNRQDPSLIRPSGGMFLIRAGVPYSEPAVAASGTITLNPSSSATRAS